MMVLSQGMRYQVQDPLRAHSYMIMVLRVCADGVMLAPGEHHLHTS